MGVVDVEVRVKLKEVYWRQNNYPTPVVNIFTPRNVGRCGGPVPQSP